jgi:hypothetical protein
VTTKTPPLSAEMARIPIEDFRLLAEKAGYRFICPMCGNVAGPEDFERAGTERDRCHERAATECIGRTLDPPPKPKNGRKPCDWAAYGLFGNLGRGLHVVFPDGKVVQTFAPSLLKEPSHDR